jgi:hypothetical protein
VRTESRHGGTQFACGVEIVDGDESFFISTSPDDKCHLRELLNLGISPQVGSDAMKYGTE